MKDITPQQYTGAESNTISEVTLLSAELAVAHYELAKSRLLNVDQWKEIAGEATASFDLHDAAGRPKKGLIAVNDHFKIDVPGPGSDAGDGFEWVQVVNMAEENKEGSKTFQMTVQPVSAPQNDKEAVAHFFHEKASSTFIVRLKDKTVSAEVYGRNEQPNIKDNSVIDKLRNTLIATFGVLGFSRVQWKQLTEAIIRSEAE